MNTTELFVELLVIGTGVISWVLIFILSLFGYDWVPWKELTSITALVPFLVLTYILGLVFDRLSDQVFKTSDKKLREKYFIDNGSYHTARTYVYSYGSEPIINLFEYGRSRIRISRSWIINYFLLAISTPVLVWSRSNSSQVRMSILITLVSLCLFGLLSLSAFLSWKKLTKNDYARLSETFAFLQDERRKNGG